MIRDRDMSSTEQEANLEADKHWPRPMKFDTDASDFEHDAFVKGYLTHAARTNLNREQIAEALWNSPINVITLDELKYQASTGQGDYQETLDYLYEQTDAVLTLLGGHYASV